MSLVHETLIDIGGRQYRMRSGDAYLEAARDGFEPHTVRLCRTLASGSEVILDVGANVGCTALLFGELARAVHAFEPSPTTYGFLADNIAQSGLTNVRVHNLGLGAESGTLTLSWSPTNRSGGFIRNPDEGFPRLEDETVQVRTLDDMVDNLGLSQVDFIKIDVEGFEGEVLKGAQRTLARFQPVVLLELNHWCLNVFRRTSVPDFLDLVVGYFPELHAVEGPQRLDVHNADDRFMVMRQHILRRQYDALVGGPSKLRLAAFLDAYTHP